MLLPAFAKMSRLFFMFYVYKISNSEQEVSMKKYFHLTKFGIKHKPIIQLHKETKKLRKMHFAKKREPKKELKGQFNSACPMSSFGRLRKPHRRVQGGVLS